MVLFYDFSFEILKRKNIVLLKKSALKSAGQETKIKSKN